MPRSTYPVFTLLCAFGLAACSPESPDTAPGNAAAVETACERADLVLYNTTIYTSNADQWTAEAVASKDGQIVFVGSNTEAEEYMCGSVQALDLEGRTVYAGFTDSHQHLEGVGRRTKTLSLFGIGTLQETVQTIEDWAANIPEGGWVQGRGWIEREWTDEQRFLNKYDVDRFTADKPLFMPRADGVSALVNTKAMELAGVTSETPDPEGGRFERELDGTPTGYVLANAMNVFREILPPETDAYLKDNLLRGLRANASLGWTQTQDAGMSYRLVGLMKEIHEEGNMAHRVYAAIPVQEAATMLQRGRETTSDDMFDVRGIKVFIDGTLGSRGAALIDNYSDADHNGFMNRTTKEELMPILYASLRQGIQIETHVIGDRAVRSLLDWYDEAYNYVPRSEWASEDLRWRMEHAQIIPPSDQQRFVELGVLPSMQPSHAIGDLNFAPDRLGRDRLSYAYPWQQLVDRGLMILAGSDAPVEEGDPRIEFYAAVARSRLNGTSEAGWHPELAVSRETALLMLTLWPAHGAFQEDLRGSIEVGKYADFTIFDNDIMTIPVADILTSENVMTIVGGEITFQRN
ncbi:amidohydrolase [Gammaproteobacteria bacterium]|jgi:predicted amidohydrolase YtcJ|nr:amidohydrolase [Pseudomonadales bacterium]MDB3898449.1 amidohydrolase [Gammaproteobacteria bacterium]HAS48700.1 amidohydrolase [Gammaproteobacteria bacterium]